MKPDQDLIQSAYEEEIKSLYSKLFQAYVDSGGNTALEQQAGERFMTGVGFARSSRDRAIQLLAQPILAQPTVSHAGGGS